MSRELHLDWETHSHADLRKVGGYRYAEDASTEILLAAYYLQRNRFLIARHLKSPPLPFFLATLGFVGWNLVKELFMARSPARAATVLRGVRDGLRLYFGAAA